MKTASKKTQVVILIVVSMIGTIGTMASIKNNYTDDIHIKGITDELKNKPQTNISELPSKSQKVNVVPLGEPYEVQWKYKEYDFGTLKPGSEAAVEFTYTNVGTNEVTITGSTSFCGCTVAEWKPIKKKKGESQSIKVEYDTNKRGRFIKKVHIYMNKNKKPEELIIKGYVPYEE